MNLYKNLLKGVLVIMFLILPCFTVLADEQYEEYIDVNDNTADLEIENEEQELYGEIAEFEAITTEEAVAVEIDAIEVNVEDTSDDVLPYAKKDSIQADSEAVQDSIDLVEELDMPSEVSDEGIDESYIINSEYSLEEDFIGEDGEDSTCQAVVDNGDHDWDEGIVTREPSYEDVGKKTYTCRVCSTTKEEDIPKLVARDKWVKVDGKWKRQYADGTFATSKWEKIGGAWYYFDASGYKLINWKKINEKWYYLGTDGARRSGWQKIDDKWYHFDSEGIMHTGWQKIGTEWYHFASSGVVDRGWKKLDGKWYHFDSKGVMHIGWQKIGDMWYHFDSKGVMHTGWQKIGTEWYHFASSGVVDRGWKKLDGKWYHFDSKGVRQSGWQKIGDIWYHFDSKGVMQTGWNKIGNEWYYMESNGKTLRGQWGYINNKWYYFGDKGEMQRGWSLIKRKYYYFYEDGHLAMNTWIGIYYVNENGELVGPSK